MESAFSIIGDVITKPSRAFKTIAHNASQYFNGALVIYASLLVLMVVRSFVSPVSDFDTPLFAMASIPFFLFTILINPWLLGVTGRWLDGKAHFKKLFISFGYVDSISMVSLLVSLIVTPLSLIGIPFFVGFSIWSFVLRIISLRECHEFSTGKALLAFVIYFALMMIAMLFIMMVGILFFASSTLLPVI